MRDEAKQKSVKTMPGLHPVAWRIPDACRLMSISRSTLYELVKRRQLRTIRIAGRVLVPDAEIRRLTSIEEAA